MNYKNRFVKVIVDRPIGSHHQDYPDTIYPINYGFVDGIIAPDGELQDAYILGVETAVDTFTGRLIAIIERKNDIENKWVVAPEDMTFTVDEIRRKTMFQEKYFDINIILI